MHIHFNGRNISQHMSSIHVELMEGSLIKSNAEVCKGPAFVYIYAKQKYTIDLRMYNCIYYDISIIYIISTVYTPGVDSTCRSTLSIASTLGSITSTMTTGLFTVDLSDLHANCRVK